MKKTRIVWIVVLAALSVMLGIGVFAYKSNLFGIRGVYYAPISESVFHYVESPERSEMFVNQCLYYNGRIYGSANYYGIHTPGAEDAREENYLCDVYYYAGRWSQKEDMLYQTQKTGKVYRLDGYDENFRIMVQSEGYYADGEDLYLLFDNLHGIWMKYGRDLYQRRLKWDAACEIYYGEDYKPVILLEPEDREMFYGALCEGRFVESTQKLREQLEQPSQKGVEIYQVVFVLPGEEEEVVRISSAGYAYYYNAGTYYISELPLKVVEMIGEYGEK